MKNAYFLPKKIRYQACLITDFKGFCLNHVIIRPGHLGLTTKRRSNKDTSIPVERLIDVVDECRMSGAKDVAVSTTKEMG